MRIILISSEQFYSIWSKLYPQNRLTKDIPTSNIYLPQIDALVLLKDSVDIHDLTGVDDVTLGVITREVFKYKSMAEQERERLERESTKT